MPSLPRTMTVRTASSRSSSAKTAGSSRKKGGPIALPRPGPTRTTSATPSVVLTLRDSLLNARSARGNEHAARLFRPDDVRGIDGDVGNGGATARDELFFRSATGARVDGSNDVLHL